MSTSSLTKSSFPKVTIGICVKNSAKTIHQAIQSVIQQDCPSELLELIFVDDGSGDDTLSIINQYAAKIRAETKVFHHDWKGLGYSRNVIVDNASGDYIIWVDGDMVLPRNHVRKQVEFMEQNPRVGIAKAKYGIMKGESLLSFLEDISYVAVDRMYGGKPTSRPLGTGGSIYRVEAIRQANGFDDNLQGVGEDMDAESRVSQVGWLLFLGSPAFFYERRRQSWRSLFAECFWHGYGGYFIFRKDCRAVSLFKSNPLAGFVVGVWYSTVGYRVFPKKEVFLLPIQYALKRAAWCLGFVKAQMGGL
jgi:glycosyltransferase involved in cell wall biosynthesis